MNVLSPILIVLILVSSGVWIVFLITTLSGADWTGM